MHLHINVKNLIFFCRFSSQYCFLAATRRLQRNKGLAPVAHTGINNPVTIRHIQLSVYWLNRILPWQANCLSLALAASRILRQCNITHHLCIGVKKHQDKLLGHAWIETSEQRINALKNYTEIRRL